MRSRTTGVVLVLGVLVSGLTGCPPADGGAATEAAAPAKTVRVAELGRDDIAEVLSYVADLKAYTEVKIFSPVPDRILYFPWKDGDRVLKGQRVALIRKEGLDKGLEGIVAQMEALDVQIRNLESELERAKGLLSAGVITQSTFDKIQTSYLATQAQRRALEASRGQLAVTASNAVINAPISGVVAGKMLEKGDLAIPQMPLCRILQLDKLKAELALVEADVPKVRLEQEVVLHLDAYPDETFTGRVSNILPYLNAGTRTNTVEVTVDNPADPETRLRRLKPGMFGRSELVVDRRAGVLVAPEQALLLDNRLLEQQQPGEVLRKAFVVTADNTAAKRLVKLGARNGARYEVLEGLAEGERIIVRGQHGLKDGQSVEVVTSGGK